MRSLLSLPLLAVILLAQPVRARAPSDELTHVHRRLVATWPARIQARLLPAARTLEIDVPLPPSEALAALGELAPPLRVTVTALEGGTRLRVHHPRARLRFLVTHRKRSSHLQFGPESGEVVMRRLADRAAAPLPIPPGLGPQLELWHDAEETTRAKELRQALRRWRRLAQLPEASDLAQLRIAQLFVISGHVNEALARMGALARAAPRTPGAALARIWMQHLSAVTGEREWDPEQVLLAARTVGRPGFAPYVWWTASVALADMGQPDVALVHMPDPAALPEGFRARAQADREDILALALAQAAAQGDARAVAERYLAFTEEIATHPEQPELEGLAARAFVGLGLPDRAEPLLQAALRRGLAPADEAHVVSLLARGYLERGDLPPLAEAVGFLARFHPGVPDLDELLRELALLRMEHAGTEAALDELEALIAPLPTPEPRRAALAVHADLSRAAGMPARELWSLDRLGKLGFDDPHARRVQRAAALARVGRAAAAAPLLRRHIGTITDPERRDHLSYLLARSEAELGHDADVHRILDTLAQHGTRWGLIARATRRERALQRLVSVLAPESPSPAAAPAPAGGAP